MKLTKPAVVLPLLAALALAMSACSSHTNSAPGYAGSAHIDCGGKQSLKASGSTAQANAMRRFVTAYQKACPGQTLDYTSNGSGAGVSEFLHNQTDFGGSDSPLSAYRGEYADAHERCGSDAWNLPIVFGPLAITFNLDKDILVLNAPTLAKIFNGTITRWDDPAISALNASMPSEPITVVYRSDESGTTDNFQQYLDAASNGAWGKGVGKTFHGGIGEGAPGNEGTSAKVRNTQGAITYNEWSFAQDQQLFAAEILTSAGPHPVSITGDAVGKTIAGARIVGAGNDLVLDTSSFYNPTKPGAYPIVLASYEIVCSKYADAAVGRAVRAFLQAAVGPGQASLTDNNGYIPLPADFQSKVSNAINAIN